MEVCERDVTEIQNKTKTKKIRTLARLGESSIVTLLTSIIWNATKAIPTNAVIKINAVPNVTLATIFFLIKKFLFVFFERSFQKFFLWYVS